MEGDSAERLFAILQRLQARKLGVRDDQPIPPSLAFLADPKRANKSLDEYTRTSEVFQKRHSEAQKAKAIPLGPTGPQPGASEFLFELGEEAFFRIEPFSSWDRVEVRLACPGQPLSTNGKWDPEKKTVSWSAGLGKYDTTPMLCFAYWSTPDQAAQGKHFGKIILRGEELAHYVLWYRGLTADEARQWDHFLAGLKPDGRLKETVGAFRFAAPSKPVASQAEDSQKFLDEARRLILEALNKAK
jgi:hypothetical protein